MATLPPGFDPRTGRLRNVNFTSPINTTSPRSSSTTSVGGSFWDAYNSLVAGIGNWFASWAEGACNVVMWIILIAIWIWGIAGVIGEWNDGNTITAILMVLFGGPIVYYASYLIALLGYVAVAIVLYTLRFIFWNGWTLLLCIGIGIGAWLYNGSGSSDYSYSDPAPIEVVEPTTTTYRVTARTLNARSGPSTSYPVVGKLSRGERIEVYDLQNGFARIRYAGQDAYVSVRYIVQV